MKSPKSQRYSLHKRKVPEKFEESLRFYQEKQKNRQKTGKSSVFSSKKDEKNQTFESFNEENKSTYLKKRKFAEFFSKSDEKNNRKDAFLHNNQSFNYDLRNSTEKKRRFYRNNEKIDINMLKKPLFKGKIEENRIKSPEKEEKQMKKPRIHAFFSKSAEKPLKKTKKTLDYLNSTSKKQKFLRNHDKIDVNALTKPFFLAKKTPTIELNANSPIKSPFPLQNLSEILEKDGNPNNSTFLSNFDYFSNRSSAKKPRKHPHFLFDLDLFNNNKENGSFFRYSIQKANRIQRRLFGTNSIITPVRSSKRIKAKNTEILTIEDIKKEKGLVYVPNELEKELPPIDENSVILQSYLQKKI